MRTLRCFTGLTIPAQVTHQIARLQDACPVGRDVPEENLHLTLAFHGDQPLDRLEEFDTELQAIHHAAFDVETQGIDLFGGKERGGLALMAAPTPPLVALHSAVARAARRAGIETERRKFRPHITFARFSRPPDAPRLQDFLLKHGRFGPLTFRATEFSLFRSTLSHAGAIYDVLSEYPLTDT